MTGWDELSTKPPRYLLREAIVGRLLDRYAPGSFLEIGYGAGRMLETLADRGFRGDGYDVSEAARETSARLIARRGLTGITLLNDQGSFRTYDYIFFFEVIGYWERPAEELQRLSAHLAGNGRMLFSFTNKRHQGYAEQKTGNMRCFSRSEIVDLVADTPGLEIEHVWNYGFPLANMLKPFLDLSHALRRGTQGCSDRAMQESGLEPRSAPARLMNAVVRTVLIHPFRLLQPLFTDTDLGTGYVVVARRR